MRTYQFDLDELLEQANGKWDCLRFQIGKLTVNIDPSLFAEPIEITINVAPDRHILVRGERSGNAESVLLEI